MTKIRVGNVVVVTRNEASAPVGAIVKLNKIEGASHQYLYDGGSYGSSYFGDDNKFTAIRRATNEEVNFRSKLNKFNVNDGVINIKNMGKEKGEWDEYK